MGKLSLATILAAASAWLPRNEEGEPDEWEEREWLKLAREVQCARGVVDNPNEEDGSE